MADVIHGLEDDACARSNFSSPPSHLNGKSSGLDEIAYKNDNVRDSSITETFTLTKGKGTAFLYFENVPIWLPALSPMCFKTICFMFVVSRNNYLYDYRGTPVQKL